MVRSAGRGRGRRRKLAHGAAINAGSKSPCGLVFEAGRWHDVAVLEHGHGAARRGGPQLGRGPTAWSRTHENAASLGQGRSSVRGCQLTARTSGRQAASDEDDRRGAPSRAEPVRRESE